MKEKVRRLAAALLACILVLAGCGGGGKKSGGQKDSGDHNSYNDSSDNRDGGISNEELLERLEELESQVAQLQEGFTLPDGTLFSEAEELTDTEADALMMAIETQERNLLAVPPSGERVKERDWSRYTSENAKSGLNSAEKQLYEQLDEVCLTYLTSPGHYVDMGSYRYISQAVDFQRLGLTQSQACDVLYWFKYNNPQYYFIDYAAATPTQLFVTVYDFAAALEDEAKATNEMFDKLDRWIAECCDNEVTTWDKVTAANQKICENTLYSPAVKRGDMRAAGSMNQTIYSVLMSPETVCAGYARTFQAMANAMGIDTYTVLSDNHAWNATRFDDGNYYFVDVCWNDQDVGYNESFLGVGTDFMADRGWETKSAHTYQDILVPFSPYVPAKSYNKAGASASITAPNLRVSGGGSAIAKVEWDPVANATAYDYFVYDGTKQLAALSVSGDVNFAYVSIPQGTDSLTVQVRAVAAANGASTASQLAQITVSPAQAGSGLKKPANVRVEHPDGLRVRWDSDSSADGWLFIGYGGDSTLTAPWIQYTLNTPTIGWTSDWQPEADTYFSVMAIRRSGSFETYSDPVLFKYNIYDGMTSVSAPVNHTGGGSSSGTQVVSITYADGATYVGEIKDGKRNGHGTYTLPSGNFYEGEWKDDEKNGYGKYTWTIGDVYEGEWRDGERNGQGTYTWPAGHVYVGEWKDGKRNGNGTMTFADGTVQEGQWKDNEFVGSSGAGTAAQTYGNGTYTGQMKNGLPNGRGKYVWTIGDVYEGDWRDGERNGQGTYTWPAGHVYVGGWKDGKRHGFGTMTFADGTVQDGLWKEDEFVLSMADMKTKTYGNGAYIGEMKNDEPNGYGRFTSSAGDAYEGEWTDGAMTGQGRYTWASGAVYEGAWKNGKRDGYGTMTYTDGSVQAGQWTENQFIG